MQFLTPVFHATYLFKIYGNINTYSEKQYTVSQLQNNKNLNSLHRYIL